MDSRRSYLDTLNAGRERRPRTTLEQINRSLENLEQQLDRSGRPQHHDDPHDRPAAQRPPARSPYAAEPERAPLHGGSFRGDPAPAMTREIERARHGEDGVAAAGRIASELKGLRDELRQQMASGLQREFDLLRKDISRAYASGSDQSAQLQAEFDRLSKTIHSLSGRSNDSEIGLLRDELEQVKGALETLAREETVAASGRRWDEFDRRFTDFEDRVSSDIRHRAVDPAIESLAQRLEQINVAVSSLPDSLSLRSLEDKVRTLAGAVDQFSRQSQGGSRSTELIEERLDEISRAIVASAVNAQSSQFDAAPFERIEARIAGLARQIEEVTADQQPNAEMMQHLVDLSGRVDAIAARVAMPEKMAERLTRQIAIIADKLDAAPAMPDANVIFNGIEQRFDQFADIIERRHGDALEQSQLLFRDLESRLGDVAARLDRPAEPAFDDKRIMSAIDQRFADLSRRLEQREETVADEEMRRLGERLEAITSRLDTQAADQVSDATLRSLEERLERITSRFDEPAGIDAEVIRSIEAQVAALGEHMSRPSAGPGEMAAIGPRIDQLEQAIAGSRASMLDAVREAAESAVRNLSGKTALADVDSLSDELKAIETLTRRSDDRNAKTFEAIHDTLLKIVDRLGMLERGEPAQAPGQRALADVPPLDDDMPGFAMDARQKDDAHGQLTPAAAAAAAAQAALDTETAGAGNGRKRSMFGGLSRAFGGRSEPEAPMAAAEIPEDVALDPSPSLDEPLDPRAANRPLEPGSAAPDLGAIMKRVRDERGKPGRSADDDAAKSDFIAAARRAAQAAAAEAEVHRRNVEETAPKRGKKLGGIFRTKRTPLLLATAAIALALGGLQVGKAFMSDPVQIAQANPEPVVPAIEDGDAEADAANAELGLGANVAVAPAAPPMATGATSTARFIEPKIPEIETTPAPEAADAAAPSLVVDPTSTPQREQDIALAVPSAGAMTAQPEPAVAAPAEPAAAAAFDVPSDAGPLPLREAAAGGDAKAMFEVATRFAEGRGAKQDLAQAATWYERAADAGLAPAQYRIGNFYEKGLGVTRDVEKAKTWYQLAAAQGNASAMHNLAVLYAMGTDGTADNDSAARWFTEAAELGVKDSQFNLGILNAKGVGIDQDLEESYKWFALVAKAGDRDAATKRDEIANSIRPDQLAKARAAVELWKPKALDAEANSVDIPESWEESAGQTAGIDMKKAVRNIQAILNKNGYQAGSPDGVMGAKTKSAISQFQKDNGLQATGEVDQALVEALLARK